MLRYLLFVVFVCLPLFITAYDASATARQAGAMKASAVSIKAAKAAKKQKAQVSAKASKSRDAKNRNYAKYRRDPASLPIADEDFAETPQSVLAVLSTVPTDGDISSFFGIRRLSTKAKRVRMHTGIDIKAARGAPVYAAASGVVCFVGRWSAYGKVVEIDHGNGLITRYAHLDKQGVEKGVAVTSGEQIGTVGSTGRATGSHLHFETLVNGKTVDPMMAEIWRQAPEHLADEHDTYVSGLRSAEDAH